MSQWDDRIEGHEALSVLRSVSSLAQALDGGDDAASIDGLERLRAVVRRLDLLFDDADPLLLTPEMLAPLVAPLSRVHTSLENFASTHDPGQLTTSNAALDEVLRSIGWIDASRGPNPEALREAAVTYRRSIGQLVRGLEEDVRGTQGQLSELAAAQGALRSSLDAASADYRQSLDVQVQQFAQRLASLEAGAETQKARLDAVITEGQQRFIAEERDRSAALAELVAQFSASGEEARAKTQSAAEETLTTLEARGTAALDALEEQRERALTIVNAVGAIAYSGGYGAYANGEKTKADRWALATAVAVGFLINGQVTLLLLPLAGIAVGPLDWEHLAQRGLVSIALLVFAGYAATQSGRHRENERLARKVELELAAIDPYLALLPIAEQIEIKAETARRMFAQPLGATTAADAVGAAQLLRLIEEFIKRTSK